MPRAPFDPATDYYRLLDVTPDASAAEIQAAYRRLAKTYHPDCNAGSPAAAARMARVNAAKVVLLDPATRATYDRARGRRYAPPVATWSDGWSPPPPPAPVRPAPAATRRSRLDRQTAVALALALPLLGALVLYVAEAIHVAGKPARTPPPDLALAPVTRATPEGTARAAFFVVAGQPPSARLGLAADQQIRARADHSPEGEVLRSIGRQLVQAGASGDAEAWDQAVTELCLLARHC